MVVFTTCPVLPMIHLLCGMMWRKPVSTWARLAHQPHHHQRLLRLRRQAPAPQQQVLILEEMAYVYRTVVAWPMVTTNHVKPARDLYPVPTVINTRCPVLPVIHLLCGMMWRNAVSTRARLAHQPHHHLQLLRLRRQAPAPQQQVLILEEMAYVYRTVVAWPMVTTNHVKPARDLYPVPTVINTRCPVLPVIHLLCGMMWRNAVSTRARLAHQPHQHQQVLRLTQPPAPQQQFVLLEHLAHVSPIVRTCPTVSTHHVNPMTNMWSVSMVCSVRKPASQTVGTCLMVYTNHANFAMPMLNAVMVCSVRLLARKVIFGMIGRRSV